MWKEIAGKSMIVNMMATNLSRVAAWLAATQCA
jgi:hypothetical protein